MGRKEKEIQISDLTAKVKGTNGIILTEYHGLTVAEITELRKKLRPVQCEYKVVKNSLSKRVLKEMGLEDFSKHFEGPTAIAIEKGDPVAGAKILVDFAKDHAKLKVKAGLLGTKVLTTAEVKALAALPSRNVLLGRLVGTLKGPMYGLVNVMQGNIRKLVYTLDAIAKQKSA